MPVFVIDTDHKEIKSYTNAGVFARNVRICLDSRESLTFKRVELPTGAVLGVSYGGWAGFIHPLSGHTWEYVRGDSNTPHDIQTVVDASRMDAFLAAAQH
uniref:Uncharacterized protein n=1 Tax=viral metagenome TaxID=1070528 RepID=A0A6M3XU93_9ZZZZ